ncbi:MAG TPA: DUF1501 domain-containing protein [Verrucomicrobiae bacterium]|nr:DUF1501 domain-containing protein [Verrucomicrobiae bacterium]
MSDQDILDHARAEGSYGKVAAGLAAAAALLAAQKAAAQLSAPPKTLVVLFQRFAADGLMALVPHADPTWNDESIRPAATRPLELVDSGVAGWKFNKVLNNSAAPFVRDIWDAGDAAFIPATRIERDTRSHFTSQAIMETAGATDADIGFCSRALGALPLPVEPILRGVSLSPYVPDLGRGNYGFLSIADPDTFSLASRHPGIHEPILGTYQGQTQEPGAVAQRTAEAIENVSTQVRNAGITKFPEIDVPNPSAAAWGLWNAARFIRARVGTQILTTDVGGWDHHANVRGNTEFHLGRLGRALVYFRRALTVEEWANTTVLVMTEFGRTIRANNSSGTDHGYGSLMWVAGGSVNQGVYGQWQPLANGLAIDATPGLNDYQRAFADVLGPNGLGLDAAALAAVLPALSSYTPYGILR